MEVKEFTAEGSSKPVVDCLNPFPHLLRADSEKMAAVEEVIMNVDSWLCFKADDNNNNIVTP